MAMDGLVEIRWHGRGGQGTATAARMAAGLASAQGKHFQAFPAFHDDVPPRRGEPVVAFTRISDRPIEEHAEVGRPGIVVLLDGSAVHEAEVTSGLASDAILLVNSDLPAPELRSRCALKGLRLFCVAATVIARETADSAFANTAMIGALARVSGLFPLESVAEFVRVDFSKRFPPELVEGNVKAAIRAYGEVRGEGDDVSAAT
jgi:pyruvate ferredoxin oxidoreductase gamma subunit